MRFHQADEPEKAVTLATRLVLEGEVDYLMKGGLETRTMMKAFIAQENGMVPRRLMSQVAFVENPFYHKLLALTDFPLFNPKPDIQPRKATWRMPWRYSTTWGWSAPRWPCWRRRRP